MSARVAGLVLGMLVVACGASAEEFADLQSDLDSAQSADDLTYRTRRGSRRRRASNVSADRAGLH